MAADDALNAWEHDVADFVSTQLPAPPCRVLDVGCGSGWLSHRLIGLGYEVTGVDPDAPDGRGFHRVPVTEFTDPNLYHAVVAVLSLHHIHDLSGAFDRITSLMQRTGTVVVVEFAWDRLDDATVRWCLERLPAERDDHKWLHRRCAEFRERAGRGQPLLVREGVGRWADEEGFHSSPTMIEQLRTRFSERFFAWSPYLYPDLEGVSAAEERSAIDSGQIQATGFRFVGRLP